MSNTDAPTLIKASHVNRKVGVLCARSAMVCFGLRYGANSPADKWLASVFDPMHKSSKVKTSASSDDVSDAEPGLSDLSFQGWWKATAGLLGIRFAWMSIKALTVAEFRGFPALDLAAWPRVHVK